MKIETHKKNKQNLKFILKMVIRYIINVSSVPISMSDLLST